MPAQRQLTFTTLPVPDAIGYGHSLHAVCAGRRRAAAAAPHLETGDLAGLESSDYWIASRLAAPFSFFGSLSSSTPSVYFAEAAFSSTVEASVKLRDTAPK